jgi:hypothetical protein
MVETAYIIPHEFAFATSSVLPKNIPFTYSLVQPLKKQYKVLLSALLAVSTTFQTIYSFKMPFSAYIKQISILPSSNASANGVIFTLQYGANTIDAGDGTPSSAAVPNNFAFSDGEYPYLDLGESITLNAGASASGAVLQLAIIFML